MPIFWRMRPDGSASDEAEHISTETECRNEYPARREHAQETDGFRFEKCLAILSENSGHQVRLEAVNWPDHPSRFALHIWHIQERSGTWAPGRYVSFSRTAAAIMACILETEIRKDSEEDAAERLN